MASADREEESLVEEDTSSVPLSGYFTKQGAEYRTWKKRYFVLKDTTIIYYANKGDTLEKGRIDLTKGYGIRDKIQTMGMGGVNWPPNVDRCVSFGIAVEGRTYYLYGEDIDEVKKWRETLQAIIEKHGRANSQPFKDCQGQNEPALSKIIRNAAKLSTKVGKRKRGNTGSCVECVSITPLQTDSESDDPIITESHDAVTESHDVVTESQDTVDSTSTESHD